MNKNILAHQEFDFLSVTPTLTPAVKQMLDFISKHLPVYTNADQMLFKSKYIITELLTNALKHSGTSNTRVNITLSPENMFITKTDGGQPLKLLKAFDKYDTHRLSITNDIMHVLYAVYIDNNELRFECEEKFADMPLNINDVLEHFGLLIITKSAEDFTYKFDELTRQNIFTARISLIEHQTD